MVRRRTEIERALAHIRRLNQPLEQPRQPEPDRRRRRYVFPEPGAIKRLFDEARKQRA